MTKIRLLFLGYILLFIALFLYSYTQVDLGLTLSRASLFKNIETSFQYIGYFNRSLATYLFIALVLLFGIFYLYILKLVRQKKLTRKFIWLLIFIMSGILLFSYNAFSYDLFNYIFDAKIFTFYHLNPYQHMALDFPNDPMLGFMHWTHRTYPYGPTWIGLTIPLSFAGIRIFILTFFLFKTLAVGAFLATCYFIEKILQKVESKESLLGLAFFAFNPLVIFESLVSAHNDIVMMFGAILAFYFLVQKKYIFAIVAILLSIGVKFATLFLLPAMFAGLFVGKLKQLKWDKVFLLSFFLMLAAVGIATYRTTFQSWYIIYPLCFAALLVGKKYIVVGSGICSCLLMLIYVPYLYTGGYNPPIPAILNYIALLSLGLGLLGGLGVLVKSKMIK